MTNFEYLRQHLELQAGIWPPVKQRVTLAEIERQFPERFVQLMRNRIMCGSLRYGLMERRRFTGVMYDHCADAIRRIKLYQATGNTEHLVDAANMCLVEFQVGVHPNKHFAASDDGDHAKRIQ